jgi:hypothetical protein
MFEEGVQDRTKYEVSRMKKEWQKLNRLYSGIKGLNAKPVAVIIVDTNFEKAAVKECKKISIPVVALIDTNSDPETADYVIPANDDAINSIKLVMHTLADAVLQGNKGNGVKHNLKDYAKVEVKISKNLTTEEIAAQMIEGIPSPEVTQSSNTNTKATPQPKARRSSKGILERVKDEADKQKKAEVVKKPAKEVTKKPAAKKTTKKVAKKKAE